jgi:hypothetical protein
MKPIIFSCILLFLISCDDESAPKDVSTVDPNVLQPIDTTAPVLNLDTNVALDSTGPTINPEDTNYRKD